ncbi:MAG TPA: sugar transferase [Verrucomicrobiales bacterium]|nr:sugar transferase [Verrucomicrobiales bacterium]HIL70344.1 sugar transferase [Verrucomicrobiota bacterium]
MSRMVHDHDIYCMRRYKYSPFTRKICRRPTGLACLFPCLAFAERQRGRNFPVGFVSYSAKLRELKLNRCIPRMIVASDYMKNEQDLKALLKGNQHHNGVTFKMKKDPRITPLGRIMRRCSIDELPQLFNVLKGDMSLVGPRPPVPREVALYTPEDRKQLSVIPGITCIWQVSGRSEIDFPDQVILDIRYIQNQGLLEDLKILFLTIPAVISGKGAY